jgi:hypothetical protein
MADRIDHRIADVEESQLVFPAKTLLNFDRFYREKYLCCIEQYTILQEPIFLTRFTPRTRTVIRRLH